MTRTISLIEHLIEKFQDLKCNSCFSNNKSTLISGLHSLRMHIWWTYLLMSLAETVGTLSALLCFLWQILWTLRDALGLLEVLLSLSCVKPRAESSLWKLQLTDADWGPGKRLFFCLVCSEILPEPPSLFSKREIITTPPIQCFLWWTLNKKMF